MQRAKLKEIAAQRAMQLRQEEEERAKEQRAKALAKLEELDRRTLALPTSVETSEHDTMVSFLLYYFICIDGTKIQFHVNIEFPLQECLLLT